tara:strand:+ start:5271 stop:5459 length:189 start_codon:yes stop_codon:yes gene_type:complete
MKCKHCKFQGFLNKTHYRIHEECCGYKNETEFETSYGAGNRKLSRKAVANIWEYISKVLDKK